MQEARAGAPPSTRKRPARRLVDHVAHTLLAENVSGAMFTKAAQTVARCRAIWGRAPAPSGHVPHHRHPPSGARPSHPFESRCGDCPRSTFEVPGRPGVPRRKGRLPYCGARAAITQRQRSAQKAARADAVGGIGSASKEVRWRRSGVCPNAMRSTAQRQRPTFAVTGASTCSHRCLSAGVGWYAE
jgi:hypothetical protein